MLSILGDGHETGPARELPHLTTVPYTVLAVFIIPRLWGIQPWSVILVGFIEARKAITVRERHSSSQGGVSRCGKMSIVEKEGNMQPALILKLIP